MSFKELVCFIQIIKFGGMEFSVVLLYYYPFNGMLLSFSMGSVLMTPLSLLVLVVCVFFFLASLVSKTVFGFIDFLYFLFVFNLIDLCSNFYYISSACFRLQFLFILFPKVHA